ncbi:MAG: hypothetical protein JHC89_16310 [Acetobacteraceae bacterium]|nr:hypothetical protein [Acetobacteraceae bacterium]
MAAYSITYLLIFLSSGVVAGLVYVLVTREPTCSWIKRFSGMQASGVNQASSALLVLSIAFLLHDVSQIRQKASETLLLEADILRTLGRVSVNLSRDMGQPMLHLLAAYSDSVLHNDWPKMQRGFSGSMVLNYVQDGYGVGDGIRTHDSNNATPVSLTKIIAISDFVYSNLDRFGHPLISQQMAASVQKLRELRLQRLELSNKHPTFEKVLLGLFFSLNAILVLLLTHADRPRALFAAVFLFSWLSLTSLFTVTIMHNPYAGTDPLGPSAIAAALERLRVMAGDVPLLVETR